MSAETVAAGAIRVVKAPPYLTVQDAGRPGYRALGIPPSGWADAEAALFANWLAGNAGCHAVLEWAVGGGVLAFDGGAALAVTGADATVEIDGKPIPQNEAVIARSGSELHVRRITRGRFVYVGVRGGVDVPEVLGSRSTLVSAGLGGHEGRRLRAGDVLPVGAAPDHARSAWPGPRGGFDDTPVPVVHGPHIDRVPAGTWEALVSATWRIAIASDRTGYRLDGGVPLATAPAGAPSEPTCVGAIQLTPSGTPVVLMHDGPTVGGYPIIAAVRHGAIGPFAQRAPGDEVRFTTG